MTGGTGPSQRLVHLSTALCARPPAAAAGPAPTAASPPTASDESSEAPPKLLTDSQVAGFIKDGFLLVPQAELPRAFHDNVYRQCVEYEEQGKPRSEHRGYFQTMPQLEKVLRTPSTVGALTSLLGPNYAQHPHRTMHMRADEVGGDQDWHRVLHTPDSAALQYM